jgi:hypothetical protein
LITINLLKGYASSIKSARFTAHTLDYMGAFASVELQLGSTGPSRTFYYSPQNFYMFGVDIQGTAYFTNDATPWNPAYGTQLPFDSRHPTLGTHSYTSVNRDWIQATLGTTFGGQGNNLRPLFALGAVFFAEALRSEPVLEACAKALVSKAGTLNFATLEHYCTNWRVASENKNAGVDRRVEGFGHRWVGLDKANYPAQ